MLPFVENWISKWIVYIWPDKATKPMSAAELDVLRIH